MHKDDQMTSRQRLEAFAKGEPIDRTPVMPFLSLIGPRLAGITLREMRNDPKQEAFFMVECYRILGHDGMMADYGLHGVGIALGSETDDPENSVPSITKFALEDLKDVGSLDMAKVERKNDPEFTKRYQAAEMMLEQAGDECGVDVSLCGPFTAAASIYPTEKLLMALRKDPEGVHRLLRFCTDCIKMICRDFWTLGTGFTLCDPVASGTILRKQDYMDFVFPYTCEIVKDLHDIGASAGYHICGNTTKIVEPMVDTGIDMLSLDGQVDMAMAKEKVGERVCIVGNVDPIDVMLNGTLEDVDAAVRRCFVQAQDSPSGFILATGCDIPNMAPVENVFRFMEAARKYGRAAAKGEPLPA